MNNKWREKKMSEMKESNWNSVFNSKLTDAQIEKLKVGELIATLNDENNEQAITITELEVDLVERVAQIEYFLERIEKLKAEIKELKGGKTSG